MRRVARSGLLACLLLGESLAAQQPTFRTGTTLVEVSAVVTVGGRPVTDLRQDEVTLLDNGEPQRLLAFERVDLGSGMAPAQRRDFVLVFDDLHIDSTQTPLAHDVAIAFIRALGPHDRLAITNTAGDDVTMDFSTDRAAAEALVKRARGQAPANLPVARGALSVASGDMEREWRARQSMQVLREVAASVRGDAIERRAVFLISEGHRMPEGGRDDHPGPFLDYLDVLREAALSNVAVYAVDPRGLQGPALASADTRRAELPAVLEAVRQRFGSLALLADNTGGLFTVWTNDLAANIPRLLQDSRQYYRLAYAQPEPPRGKKQPRARRIEVKVSRPSVEVRARQQYAPVGGS